MVPEIYSMTNRFFVILDCFLSFYPSMHPENQNFEKMKKKILRFYYFKMCFINDKWSYDAWFLRYWVQQTEFFVILDCFLPFYPPNNPKNQNFEKMKKTLGNIIILHRCMYHKWQMVIWCMVPEISSTTTEFFVILDHFLPKNQNFEKMKKNSRRYHHFTQVYVP